VGVAGRVEGVVLFPHDYANDNLNLVRLSRDYVIAQKQATGLPGIMDLYGIGDHGGGPTRAILDEGFHWAAPGHVTPKIEFGTAQSYFSRWKSRLRRRARCGITRQSPRDIRHRQRLRARSPFRHEERALF